MPYGSHFSSQFIEQLSEKEVRDEFVADRVKTHIALAIKALREQAGREWSQKDLGDRADKPQSVISRLEDPDYGKMSLQTLLEVAAAFDLPLLVDIADWSDWLIRTADLSKSALERTSFDSDKLAQPPSVEASGVLPSFEMPETLTSANRNLTDLREARFAVFAT
jgi:transcriptional regulator with XRE-family HTH domain